MVSSFAHGAKKMSSAFGNASLDLAYCILGKPTALALEEAYEAYVQGGLVVGDGGGVRCEDASSENSYVTQVK